MIIAVSDLHLGIDQDDLRERRFKNFLIYLKENLFWEGGDLVLLGDIFDFWMRDLSDVLLHSGDVIEKLCEMKKRGINIHYVVGNHDYFIHTLARECIMPFDTIGKSLVLLDGPSDSKFKFMHGYQLEVLANPYIKDIDLYENLAGLLCRTSGITSHVASGLIGSLIYRIEYGNYRRSMRLGPEKRLSGKHNILECIENMAISKARPLYLGADAEDWFVFGHTHNPFLDNESRTINTGSWLEKNNEGYLYLKINQGKPKLEVF